LYIDQRPINVSKLYHHQLIDVNQSYPENSVNDSKSYLYPQSMLTNNIRITQLMIADRICTNQSM